MATPQEAITTTEIILTAAGAFGSILVSLIGYGINRVFNKLDSISKRFEEIAEAFRKIYIDIHHADDKIWARLGEVDKRLVRLEVICDRRKPDGCAPDYSKINDPKDWEGA